MTYCTFFCLSPSPFLSVLPLLPPPGLKSKLPDFMRRRKKSTPVLTSSPELSEEEEEEEKDDDKEWTPSVSGNPTLSP